MPNLQCVSYERVFKCIKFYVRSKNYFTHTHHHTLICDDVCVIFLKKGCCVYELLVFVQKLHFLSLFSLPLLFFCQLSINTTLTLTLDRFFLKRYLYLEQYTCNVSHYNHQIYITLHQCMYNNLTNKAVYLKTSHTIQTRYQVC